MAQTSLPPAGNEATGGGLKPLLGVTAAILLTLSCITPASSLFIIVPSLLTTQGSGVVLTLLAGVVVSIGVGACYAELGTRTPSSGGEYAMVTHTLGRRFGWVTFVLAMGMMIVIPPIIALGTADYLAPIVNLDRPLTAAIVMLLAMGAALLNLRANAWVTSSFLAIETIAAAVVAYLGFSHAQRPITEIVAPQALDGSALTPFTAGILISGLAVAMFVTNGFGTAAYLAEEIVNPRRNVAVAVFGSLLAGAVIIVVPTIGLVIGAGSVTQFAGHTFPDFVTEWAGTRVSAAISVGVAIAILNAVIVMVLQSGRVIYASARDKAWPEAVNRVLTRLHPRFNSPYVATMVIAIPSALLAAFAGIEALLGVTGVMVSLVYLLLALAALAARRKTTKGWRMPLWPAVPVFVICAVGYAITQSAVRDLIITGCVVLIAVAYDLLYLRPRGATRFIVDPKDDR